MPPSFSFGRTYDTKEILADGLVHTIGVVLAVIGATALILRATGSPDHGRLAAVAIYGLGLVTSLAISFGYNMLPPSPIKWQMRRLDHSAIFILIAATYTPFLQAGAQHPRIHALLIAIWIFAAIGIAIKCLAPGRYDRLAVLLYLAMGWSGLFAVEPLARYLPPGVLGLIVVGGVLYSAGSHLSPVAQIAVPERDLARLRGDGGGGALRRGFADPSDRRRVIPLTKTRAAALSPLASARQ